MSLSISSRIPSFRAPETVLPFKPTFAAATPEVTDPSASSKPVSLFQNDSFSAEPASGTGDVSAEGGAKGIEEMIKMLEEVAKRITPPELGEAPPAPKSLKDAGEVKEGEEHKPNVAEGRQSEQPVEGQPAEELKAA